MLIDTAAGIAGNVMYFNMAAKEIIVVVTPEPTSLTDAYAMIKLLHQSYEEEDHGPGEHGQDRHGGQRGLSNGWERRRSISSGSPSSTSAIFFTTKRSRNRSEDSARMVERYIPRARQVNASLQLPRNYVMKSRLITIQAV